MAITLHAEQQRRGDLSGKQLQTLEREFCVWPVLQCFVYNKKHSIGSERVYRRVFRAMCSLCVRGTSCLVEAGIVAAVCC